MARPRVLWDAIDSDRRRWIRASIVVLPFLVLTAFSVWMFAATGSLRAIEFVIRGVVPVTAVVLFPVLRGWRSQSVYRSIGAVPVATGMLPTTKSALADVKIAAGLPALPELYLFSSYNLNAFEWTANGKLNIAVSAGFSAIPEDEQRAGLAMLVGRTRVDVTAFAAEHELAETSRDKSVPPESDPILFNGWLDAAIAGDHEGLELLREPVPMICLLERLSNNMTGVPEFARNSAQHDACFGFLAWPYRSAYDATGSATSELPPKAAAALGAFLAEEMTDGSTLGTAHAHPLGNSEALRAQRLREVSGAEGAIAGSTSAVASARAASAVALAEPASSAGAPLRGPALAVAVAVAGSGGSHSASQAAPAPAQQAAGQPTAAEAAAGHAPAAAPRVGTRPAPAAPAIHIEVNCPSCGADNAPANRVCIRCGAALQVRA